jgi:hypothetical protein
VQDEVFYVVNNKNLSEVPESNGKEESIHCSQHTNFHGPLLKKGENSSDFLTAFPLKRRHIW